MESDLDAVIRRADAWLDGSVDGRYKDEPLGQDWARVAKVCEEAGEAISALIGYTGQNPRKGNTHVLDQVLGELADVVCTGTLAIQHFTKNTTWTDQIIKASFDKLRTRIPDEYV